MSVHIGTQDNFIYAIEKMGSVDLKWFHATGGNVESSPALGPDGTVYVRSNDNVYAITSGGLK
jgi:hypothetical protein